MVRLSLVYRITLVLVRLRFRFFNGDIDPYGLDKERTCGAIYKLLPCFNLRPFYVQASATLSYILINTSDIFNSPTVRDK